jgi:hypothetical protein
MKIDRIDSQAAGHRLAQRQRDLDSSPTEQVGRVTPCAPQPALELVDGAHGVTRPALQWNLLAPVLAVAVVTFSTCIASAQPTTTFTKIIAGDIVNDGGIGWGAAWGDFDDDGFIDLVVANEGADCLYRNNRNGTFTRVTSGPVVENDSDLGASVAFADYDNDGHLDLIVAGFGAPTKLFRNNGAGTFTKAVGDPSGAGGDSNSASWGDYDNDGHVDVMVTQWGQPNLLYRNKGDGSFERMTSATVGSIASDTGQATAGVWSDYDDDGDLDLLVTNFNLKHAFYRNNGDGTFTRLFADDIGDLDDAVSSKENGGASWADFDNDGDLDVFVTRGGAGSLRDDALYVNGNGSFTKATQDSIGPLISDQQPGGNSAWADYDNDGWLDLYVANPGLSIRGGESGRPNLLYHNNGNGTFTQVTTGSMVEDVMSSNSGIWGDYDNDGFMDLFVANGGYAGGQADSLYRNDGNTNAWLKLKLIGTTANRSAIGAKVRVKATINGTTFWQMREISGGDGFLSQNDMRPNFGLGNATNADIVRIEWPSGRVQEFQNVSAKQILTVTEPPRLEPSANVLNGIVELKVRGWKGFTYGIEASTDLKAWTRLATATNLTGAILAADPSADREPWRFYRLVVP